MGFCHDGVGGLNALPWRACMLICNPFHSLQGADVVQPSLLDGQSGRAWALLCTFINFALHFLAFSSFMIAFISSFCPCPRPTTHTFAGS